MISLYDIEPSKKSPNKYAKQTFNNRPIAYDVSMQVLKQHLKLKQQIKYNGYVTSSDPIANGLKIISFKGK
jgi:translation elongation factor EF-1beta